MKNLLFLLIVFILFSVSSCKKDNYLAPTPKSDVAFVNGSIVIQNGDVNVKSVLLTPVDVRYSVYEGVKPAFTLLRGDKFLVGSAPNLWWSVLTNNPIVFPYTTSVYSNFTPCMPVRMAVETLNGVVTAPNSKVVYLGIADVNATASSFPLTIYGKRLGDVVTLNTDALTALPGYTTMNFKVSYTLSTIDIDKTIKNSAPTTETNWLEYSYSGVTPIVDQLVNGVKDANGYREIYDGLDSKITSPKITIKITIDTAVLTLETDSPILGKGLALKLTTTKVGWYDSATMTLTNKDITVEVRNIAVE